MEAWVKLSAREWNWTSNEHAPETESFVNQLSYSRAVPRFAKTVGAGTLNSLATNVSSFIGCNSCNVLHRDAFWFLGIGFMSAEGYCLVVYVVCLCEIILVFWSDWLIKHITLYQQCAIYIVIKGDVTTYLKLNYQTLQLDLLNKITRACSQRR